jgi:hypothetical protein
MKNKQDEKLFDDALRFRLASAAEEVPGHLWDKISAKSKRRKGLLWFFGSITGFLFQDILMAALLVLVSAASPSFTGYERTAAEKLNDVSSGNIYIKDGSHSKTNAVTGLNDVKEKSSVTDNRIAAVKNMEEQSAIYNKKESDHKQYHESKAVNPHFTHSDMGRKRKVKDDSDKTLLASANQFAVMHDKENGLPDSENRDDLSSEDVSFIVLRKLIVLDVPSKEDEAFFSEVKSYKSRRSVPVSVRLAAGTVYDNSKIKSQKELNNTTADWFNKSSALFIADIRIADNWLIAAGIQQLQSELNVSITDAVPLSYWNVDTVNGFIISPFNPPVPYTIYDSSLVNATLAKIYSGNIAVKLTMLTLQLERSLHKRAFDFRFGAGIGLNISAVAKGDLVLHDAESKESVPMENTFKNNSALSLLGSFETGYYIGGVFEPFVRIQYNKSFSNLMKESSVLYYKNETIGGSIGIRIRFNK